MSSAATTRGVDPQRLPLQRLYEMERRFPDRIALTQPENGNTRDWTWREVAQEVRMAAAYLRSLNYPPNSRIAILSKNCAHWLIADLAIWMAGHVSVPLYATLSADAVARLLAHSESRLMFVGKLDDWTLLKPGLPDDVTLVHMPPSIETRGLLWRDVLRQAPPLDRDVVREGGEAATIIYTSGTTGVSKGVVHSFNSLAWAAEAALKRLPVDADSRLISYLPLAHVAERGLIQFAGMAVGARIYFADTPDTFVDDLRRARPTVFFSVPRLWLKFQQRILAQLPQRKLDLLLRIPGVAALVRRKILDRLGLDRCVFAIGGAAPMPVDLMHWYGRLGLRIADAYGMSENGALSHSTWPQKWRPGTVGWPIDGVECRLEPTTREIQLRSGGLMIGYYKDPEQTAETLTPDGWLRTGDVGEFTDDGALRITGRLKDVFKTSKGKYIAPALIEAQLGSHESVESCAVVGSGLAQPVGIVMLSESALAQVGDPVARQRLVAALTSHIESVNSRLESHERLACVAIGRTVWSVANGLLTPTLKVRRVQIEAAYRSQFEPWLAERRPVVWKH